MGVTKPTGGYAEPMLDPGGWPEADEQMFYDRAQQYTQVFRQVTDVLETCQLQRARIFEGGVWSGAAADAANAELRTLIDGLTVLQNGLVTVITWHKYVAQTLVSAKSDVADNIVEAHRTIAQIEQDPSLEADERTLQINTVVSTTHGANVSIVEGTAAQILVSKSWKPPPTALQDLLDQKTPPPVSVPNAPVVPPSRPAQPAPVAPGTGGLTPPGTPGAGSPTGPGTPPLDGGGLQPSTPLTPTTPGPPGGSQPLTPVGPAPVAPGTGSSGSLAPATPATPLSPPAGTPPHGGGAGGAKGVTPASATAGVLPASARGAEAGTGAPGGAAGVPAAAMGAGGPGAGGSGGGGSSGRSGGSVGQGPADKSAGTKPAASSRTAGKSKPRAQSMHPQHADDGEVGVMPGPVIPVSAARAERDAVAEAATADASRRAGPDPLQLARRIGAALNAPDAGGVLDLGFFWVTAVTTDGAIVVANSYGLAYIPDGVRLPEKVHLASGDEAIPATERARWATYPVLAVRGWADHHNKRLRAVIGTEEQLANSDAGVATIVLKPDDIPDSGDMLGRSRLEVVDVEAAELLTAMPDARLAELLPPAPAGAEPVADLVPAPAEIVDPEAAAVLVAPRAGAQLMGQLLAQMPSPEPSANAPGDDRFILWFEVMKPLASTATGRQAAHLRAFQTYAAHAEEALLREAHTADEPAAQRGAIADWLYWKYLSGLLNAALADPRILSPT
ncbi:secretion protein EspK [Mycobacterium shigaense]|uniref:Uncharacterized protein n=1 Tax=Mycobacterium shigaense TaxID=722731 RepID=A0A1Z4EPW5_9MYCO|nr:secretion protein EspK [Mycobacterium shigaense]MEA1121532.1 secretion protein EspK [Mycobacterium shigaense]PRI15183.1 hypothetical protein B2J96_12245 [Mycobacterium shigaense]BAX95054.1 hypothetical protein MSG_04948 [Mycobacterium shigaense]